MGIRPNSDVTTLRLACIICRSKHHIQVSQRGYDSWKKGERIQTALPMLTDEERELIISRICGKCFDNITGGC